MDDHVLIQPPGCAEWPDDEWPTDEETSNPLFDLSSPENTRKLARAIACQNEMVNAGILSGEIAYAYQHEAYNVACIKDLLSGSFEDDLEEVLTALAGINDPNRNDVARVFMLAAQGALDQIRGQFGSQLELWD
jgi:hypothetical protein